MAEIIKTIYFYDDGTYREELPEQVSQQPTNPSSKNRVLPPIAINILNTKAASLKIRCNLAVYLSVKANPDKKTSLLRKIADSSYEISRHLGISYNSVINTMRRELKEDGIGTSAEEYKELLSTFLSGSDDSYKDLLYMNISKRGREKADSDKKLLDQYLV